MYEEILEGKMISVSKFGLYYALLHKYIAA